MDIVSRVGDRINEDRLRVASELKKMQRYLLKRDYTLSMDREKNVLGGWGIEVLSNRLEDYIKYEIEGARK